MSYSLIFGKQKGNRYVNTVSQQLVAERRVYPL